MYYFTSKKGLMNIFRGFTILCNIECILMQGVKLFEKGWHPNFDLPNSPFIDINPISLEWVPSWHTPAVFPLFETWFLL